MRRTLRVFLLLSAAAFVAARLFTGIVFEHDDPTTYLILKRAASLAVVQQSSGEPIRQQGIILDGDENELAYQPAYVLAMRSSFLIAAALVLASILTRARRVPR